MNIQTKRDQVKSVWGAFARGLMVVAFAAVLTGCATPPGGSPRDPWEGYNRSMTQINEKIDAAVLKPAATLYTRVTPALVRTGVSNFFSNLTEPWSALNAALQLKGLAAIETFMRFSINTFFGLGGVLDIAGELGIEKHYQDFGLTLARWGVPSGPYFVMPIYGPSTVRDAAAFGLELQADPVHNQTNQTLKDSLVVLRGLELRASLLRAGNVLEEAALDKYTFTRDVFLQRRDNLVFDGKEPPVDAEKPPER